MKLDLKNITLAIIDSASPTEECISVLNHCSKGVDFGAQIAFTRDKINQENIESHTIKINSLKEYSIFVIKQLCNYIKTDYCLIVQTDGFILNPHLWENEFLNYDYVGAPWPDKWPDITEKTRIGNGGFSLRSRKLMEKAAILIDNFKDDEDVLICRRYNEILSLLYGIKFAPIDIAARFSTEHATEMNPNTDFSKSFGFHGKFSQKHLELKKLLKDN